MKTKMSWWFGAVVMLSAMACQTETTVTGSYGSSAVNGRVVLTESIASHSPAGIEVRAVGTGLTARTNEAGEFTMTGLPDRAVDLTFQREDDQINARLAAVAPGPQVVVELSKNQARRRGRGVGHPGMEIEGVVKSFATGSLVVTSPRLGDVTVVVDDKTVIRKGNQTLATDALVAGVRVHVKASVATDGTKTAVEIKIQNGEGDDDEENGGTTMTANGRVSEVGADQITVHTADGRDVVVKVDASTIIKYRGQPYEFAKIKVGDHVETMGTRVDDTTELAKKIEIQPAA
jgi:hypothetical protein